MQFFVRAVVTGFALSLGAALYKKVAKELGLDGQPARDGNERVVDSAAAPTS